MALVTTLMTLLGLLFVSGAASYAWVERQTRRRWLEAAKPNEAPMLSAGDPFRAPTAPLVQPTDPRRAKAPLEVRRAAFGSLLMGQAFIPLVGYALASGSAWSWLVVAPPLVLTLRLLRNGFGMLQRAPGAERESERLSKWLLLPSLAVLFVQPACTLLVFHDAWAPMAWTAAAITGLAFLQSRALGRAARVLETAPEPPKALPDGSM